MKLTLALNLGREDARRIGIRDLAEAQRGKEVTIKDEKVLNEFRARGLVVETAAAGTRRDAPQAAPAPADAGPDFDGMTLAELRDYAAANHVEGVTTAMNKDDTLKAVKKAAKAK